MQERVTTMFLSPKDTLMKGDERATSQFENWQLISSDEYGKRPRPDYLYRRRIVWTLHPKKDIEDQVCEDIKDRQLKGIQKYGMTVSENPLELKEWIQHAYEECLDQAVYLKRILQSLEEKNG